MREELVIDFTVLGASDSKAKATLQRAKVNTMARDFPAGPVDNTPSSQNRGPRFNPWSGNEISHATVKIKDPASCN